MPQYPQLSDWMRQRRAELDLTQEMLAERVGCAIDTIRALENARRRASRAMADRLAAVLQIPAEDRDAFVSVARSLAPPVAPPAEAAPPRPPTLVEEPHNLPLVLSSFVGREAELATLGRLLRSHRLVTLTGAGGSGKTRLAIVAAAEAAADHADGVWLVELAGLADGTALAETIARSLGLRGAPGADARATLLAALRPRHTLLVLDNCEHLVDACASLVGALLSACPHLRVCATSREVLRVPGEYAYLVPTLPAPPLAGPISPEEAARYPAVQLFLERVAALQPAFALDPSNVRAVVEICARLDGIPLAIELAAARMRSMSLQQIVERLHNSLRLLTEGSRTALPRQQTMRATLDWSYALLDPHCARLFRRLSVFVGGWDLDAAEVIGAAADPDAPPVADCLARLVEQSLVAVDEQDERGVGRYRLLEPLRQYATVQLEASGEAGAIRPRHAAIYLNLAEAARPELRRAAQVTWLNRLGRDHDNLRAALTWALQAGEVETAASITWSLWPFWWIRNLHREGLRWAERVLVYGEALPATLLARVTMAAAAMAYGQADDAQVIEYTERLLELSAQAGGDAHAEGYAYAGFGLVAVNGGHLDAALAHLRLAMALLAQSGEAGMAAQAHTWIGTVLLLKGDHAAARARFERGLAAGSAIGDRLAITNALFNLGQIALATGEYAEGADRLRAGLPLSYEMDDRANLAFILEGLAVCAAAQGHPGRAAELFGAAEGIIERLGLRGHSYYQPDRTLYTRAVAETRERLGDEAARLWEAGRALPLHQVLALAAPS